MKKTAQMGLLLSFAMILSYVESLIPFPFGIPGMKLGLANFAIVSVLYLWDAKDAFYIDLLRIVLISFLFGNMSMMLYSLSGGMISVLAMIIMKKTNLFSSIGVSMGGGVFHNIGQLLVAFIVLQTDGLMFYVPVLLIFGLITGFLIGIIHYSVRIRLAMFIHAED